MNKSFVPAGSSVLLKLNYITYFELLMTQLQNKSPYEKI
jgi:hypothetical protein